jgi:hypothetical protein
MIAGEVKSLQLWAMDRALGEDLWSSFHELQQAQAAQQVRGNHLLAKYVNH